MCADGGFVAVAPLEGKFYAELLRGLGLESAGLPRQMDRTGWPAIRARLATAFLTRGRDEWASVFEGTDACVAPVLTMDEAPDHPHLRARGTYVEVDGVVQPAPAPRFSRSVPSTPAPPAPPVTADEALSAWFDPSALAVLRNDGLLD